VIATPTAERRVKWTTERGRDPSGFLFAQAEDEAPLGYETTLARVLMTWLCVDRRLSLRLGLVNVTCSLRLVTPYFGTAVVNAGVSAEVGVGMVDPRAVEMSFGELCIQSVAGPA
jgi:hypothetical protein